MRAGPATGGNSRARVFRAALPCLALIVLTGTAAQAQTVTPDLFSSTRSSQMTSPDSPLRRTAAEANDPLNSPKLQDNDRDKPAPSRIGQIPKYGLPAASGAADSGYDSLNRKRKKPKYYPGQARPKPPVGPGSPPLPIASNTRLRLSIPPSESAHKTPIAPAMAGAVVGQPPRKRLRIDDDPFGAVGDYAGSFLIKSAVEFSGGYDTNPGRLVVAQAKPFYVIAPEFVAFSDWERHALVADLRGSFTGYTSNLTPNADGTPLSAPLDIDRPSFIGHVDGRLDVSRDTRLGAQGRLFVSTDNPGSPNVQAGLARYPIYTTVGGTLGVDQSFNRLQVSAGATVDRTDYTNSKLTDGTSSTNDDRNFSQYGGVGRVSYDLRPGLKPFVEVQGDSRVHDLRLDRNGFARDSNGGYVKGGTSFEFSRLLTGEIGVGYAARDYADGLDRDAADDGKVLFRHHDHGDHAARHVRRADAYLHRRSRPRLPPLADRDRQVHLGGARLSGQSQARQDLHAVRRGDLQDEPQRLAQRHAAAGLAGFEFAGQQHRVDGGDAGGQAAALRVGARALRHAPRRRGIQYAAAFS